MGVYLWLAIFTDPPEIRYTFSYSTDASSCSAISPKAVAWIMVPSLSTKSSEMRQLSPLSFLKCRFYPFFTTLALMHQSLLRGWSALIGVKNYSSSLCRYCMTVEISVGASVQSPCMLNLDNYSVSRFSMSCPWISVSLCVSVSSSFILRSKCSGKNLCSTFLV